MRLIFLMLGAAASIFLGQWFGPLIMHLYQSTIAVTPVVGNSDLGRALLSFAWVEIVGLSVIVLTPFFIALRLTVEGVTK